MVSAAGMLRVHGVEVGGSDLDQHAGQGTSRVDRIVQAPRSVRAVLDGAVLGAALLLAGHPGLAAALVATAVLLAPRGRSLIEKVLNELPRTWGAIAAAALVAAAIDPSQRGAAAGTAIIAAIAVTMARTVLAAALGVLRRRGYGLRPTLLIGVGSEAARVADKIEERPELGLRVASTVAPGTTVEDLPELIRRWGVQEVIVVPDQADTEALAACLEACDGTPARVSVVPPLGQFLLDPRRVDHIGGIPVILLGRLSRQSRPSVAKRALDIATAGAALTAMAPLLAIVAVLVKLDSPGPVLFRQRRVGHGGEEFDMLKFRSMVDGADRLLEDVADQNESDGLLFKLHDDPRITRVGRWIRKFSIDELPQLVNVLLGQMSLVGPRPLPVTPTAFGAIDGKRHNARPGITGLWQTVGRSHLGYDEMVKLDLAYIQNWSFWSDVQILLRTVPVVLRGEGAY